MLGGVDAEAVEVGVGDPEAVDEAQAGQGRASRAVLPVPPHPDVQRLEAEHVPLGVLGVVVPVGDVPLAEEQLGRWNSRGQIAPSGQAASSVRPRRRAVAERQRRPPVAVVEARDGVGPAVPARVVVPPSRGRVVRRVAVGVIGEDVAGVVGNDVEDDVDALLVGGLDEVAELLARAEVRVHVEEVLDAVAVVARLECDLAERRADPQRGDAQPAEVAELARQPLDRAALPAAAGAEPGVVIDRGRRPRAGTAACRRSHGAARIVRVAAFLVAVGEAVQHQEVQHLVLPGGRRRGERPPGQRGEVDVQQAFLDRLSHRTLRC